MGLKLAVGGKGGVGKSTIAAAFAHLAVAEGRRVLAIDADPDANLAASLGMSEADRRRIIPLSKRSALIEERTGAKIKRYGQVFKLNPDVADIAEEESASFRGIHLLVLGAVESGGSGCACPESVMLRALLTDVILYKKDCVILDMEAGLEHLGRATAQGVDLMLVVVEPGRRAVETAAGIRRMGEQIGIDRFAVLGNKVSGEEDRAFLKDSLSAEDYLGELPYRDTIRRADREDVCLADIAEPDLLAKFRGLWCKVVERSAGRV